MYMNINYYGNKRQNKSDLSHKREASEILTVECIENIRFAWVKINLNLKMNMNMNNVHWTWTWAILATNVKMSEYEFEFETLTYIW